MKKIIIFILIGVLYGCTQNPHKCVEYKGDKECVRFLKYMEIIKE